MAPDSNSGDLISDYSLTQRIVLLIDLHPLLHLQDPTPFLTSLLSSVKTLTSFPPLSFSLFAVRLFFSSLSPLQSSFKLPSSSLSLSFNSPESTYLSLSETLDSLSFDRKSTGFGPPRAKLVAAAMRQLLHDYAWEPAIFGDSSAATGMLSNSDALRSNLVVLFSALKCMKSVCEFMSDASLVDLSEFSERFRGVFGNVDEAFVCRDVQLSWIDVRYEFDCGEDEVGLRCGVFEKGIRSLGWGFCSSDSIVLGSALVPFGLIYPEIGVSSKLFGCNDRCRKARAQFSLEISDVKGMPLECKLCDLELADMRMLRQSRGDDGLFLGESMSSQTRGCEVKRRFWGSVGDGVTKIQVKALQKKSEFVKFKGELSDPILVCEASGKDGKEGSAGFFVDKVLEMLSVELGEYGPQKLAPVWQILLSFLYRESCCALVSISNDSGVSYTGFLKPFTASSGLLFILDEGSHPHKKVLGVSALSEGQPCPKLNSEMCKPDAELNNLCGLQTGPSPSKKHSAEIDRKKKCRRRSSHSLKDLTWSGFCKAAFEYSDLHLEEIYFTRQCSSSKKLKFLKCWMKQIKKLKYSIRDESKVHHEIQKEMDNRLDVLHQGSEQPMSSCGSVGENSLSEAFGVQDEAAQEYILETSEAFFSNLCNKIQQGVESKEVDLWAFAHRLVCQSVYFLNQKPSTTAPSENQTPEKSDILDDLVTAGLLKALVRDPKDMAARHKIYESSFQASGPGSEGITSEIKVREYELQILFRMEILQSEVGSTIKDSAKQKFVKHICTLLESICDWCHLEGGFFGDWTLENYAGKIIKSRYCQTLKDVVHKIYTKMDLFLFDDEDEPPNNLFNSDDSNQSYRELPGDYEVDENSRIKELASADNESPDPQNHNNERSSAQVGEEKEQAHKLMKAQKKRERARRFASFTSSLACLRRVSAPKQPKAFRPKFNSLPKPAKRKEHADSYCERVLETPMTENKRIRIDDEDYRDNGSRLISKSLFQDD
ncbi:uncharacterized protein LOC126802997 [Argentina anserina]|uniref:uncharacterized protein LOC126802997 n=1 Tax=Argentina anserina TaxID=57926 RepID=UPI00217684F0|nr:uncharacterized protein LOC126802997 [Potentilla anserina]